MATQLILPFLAMGDQVSVTAIPEAYFSQRGECLFYSDERIWVFKHNPFIQFRPAKMDDTEFIVYPDAREPSKIESYAGRYNSILFGSQTEFVLHGLGLDGGANRHPRLYLHEEQDIVPHKLVVHTTGSRREQRGELAIQHHLGEDEVRVLSDEVIAAIRRNYRDWLIVQVGAADDKPIEGRNVIDLRGKLDPWESAAEIASAARFIGVNSGPMHIANCYPRVSKRIVLMEFSADFLKAPGTSVDFPLRAGDIRHVLTSWLDPANTYFNRFGQDYGTTLSYLKI
ncbi:hypothetical protein SAMN05446935_5442 [Burkholderia sp. YR290]|jgi:hypothetical protein|uniref:hypothetical protein n=1 Tax=Paraburkholderia hospita TaxID=169430 RepID=UPI0009A6389F|nr:hypothetical protein [Paraburkholderia hospita]SKC86913.1 hypothetical protein SAMN05446934_4364 [Paraburkholderia hospita]SOE84985.1 hypothetical protein SAMN05446935_5442 [Burkholderia sp. YR290]